MQKCRENIGDNITVTLDGAWDHRRHGSSNIVTLMDFSTRKIIDFSIHMTDKQFVKGNTDECSKNLEKEGVEEIVNRWKDSKKHVFTCTTMTALQGK